VVSDHDRFEVLRIPHPLCFSLRFLAPACWFLCALPAARAADSFNWTQWRGPLQTGVSLEKYEKHLLPEKPLWTSPLPAQGTPLVIDGKLYILGYRGEFDDLSKP
jgi:hypothetical protein